MNTEVTTPLTFEQKLSAKMRENISSLMTDEDLSKLVHRSLEEVFFAPRKNPKKTYSYNSNEPDFIPPLIHDLTKEMLQPLMLKVIQDYIKEHNDEVLTVVKEVVTAGVGNAVVSAMNTQFQSQLITFQTGIQHQLTNRS